jgi:GxxExxY protein
MRFDPTEYPHSDLTERIIGAAMAVHRALGPGLNESIYENSLCIELAERGIPLTQQQQFAVFYKSKDVGTLITDVIADNKVIVETKVASSIIDLHMAQTISYLCISKLQVGLILNFKNPSLEFKRVANTHLKISKSA